MRIGFKNDNELMAHDWLVNMDEEKQLKLEYDPPFKPEITSDLDVENFNPKCTAERPKMTQVTDEILGILNKHNPMFAGFYIDNEEWKPRNPNCINLDEDLLSPTGNYETSPVKSRGELSVLTFYSKKNPF